MNDPLEEEFKQVIEEWERQVDFYVPGHLVESLAELLAIRARHLLEE